MTITGTCYFVSFKLACRYYADIVGSNWYDPKMSALVESKIADGSICIGMPPMKPNQLISRIDGGTRYALVDSD